MSQQSERCYFTSLMKKVWPERLIMLGQRLACEFEAMKKVEMVARRVTLMS